MAIPNMEDMRDPPEEMDIDMERSTSQPFIALGKECDKKTGIWNSSRHKKVVFLLLLLRELSDYTAGGAMPNLFPPEASSRGVSGTVTGWIFGVFPLIQCVASPLAGRMISVLGTKRMLIIGNLVFGSANVLFGCVAFLPNDVTTRLAFTILCFLLRSLEALGSAVATTAVYAISTYTYADNPATVLGLLETSVGLGAMFGPVIGGLLLEVGGFSLAFIVLGGLGLLLTPAFIKVIDDNETEGGEPGGGGDPPAVSLSSLLRIPTVALMSAAVLLSGAAWGALEPTLEPHLAQYNLSVVKVSLVFLLASGLYTLSAPAVGVLADRMDDCNVLIIIGFLIMSVGYLFLGPSSLLHMNSNLNMDLVSLTVISVGWSLSNVPNMAKMIQAAEERDIASSMALHCSVAGLFNGMYFLGEAIGPVFGSWTTDVQGFGWTTTYLCGINAVMTLALCVLWVSTHRHCLRHRAAKTKPKLEPEPDYIPGTDRHGSTVL